MKRRRKLTVLTEVKSWAWPELREKILTLLAEEPEFVGEHACFVWPPTPLEFLNRYGLLSREEIEENTILYGWQYIDPEKQPVAAIQKVLYKAPSWGEFIGGVIGAVGGWPEHDRQQVLPYLHTAVQKALARGVDH